MVGQPRLTTNPATLYNRLVDAGGKSSGDTYLLKTLSELYANCDPVLSPALRAALYQVIGKIHQVSGSPVTIGGRPLYQVHQNSQVAVTDLLLDPATGQVAGETWTSPDAGGPSRTIELWYRGVVDQAGQRP